MSHSPFEHAGNLRIGTVDFVSPDEVKVALDIEAPESVAMNAGGPRPFPRVNGYVLISVDDGFLVGQIEWLTIERSAFPKRRGMQDFGLVDLPYPARKLSLNPLGILRPHYQDPSKFVFRRGADSLPSVGAAVMLPTDQQLRSIVQSGERRRVKVGTSPLASDAEVCVDPDRLFGRHLAVLGNTGSGKSCSVAGLIRWSLEQAQQACQGHLNARFVILDPNGEYARAFGHDSSALTAKIFRVETGVNEFDLKVPLWFWNSQEWASFTQASAKTQRPLLRRALREVKAGRTDCSVLTEVERRLRIRRRLSSMLIGLRRDLRSNAIQTEATKFGFQLDAVAANLEVWIPQNDDVPLAAILDAVRSASASKRRNGTDRQSGQPFVYFVAFTDSEVQRIVTLIEAALGSLGGIVHQEGPDEDVPLPFSGTDLADHLEILAEQDNVSQYLDFLVARIRTLLADTKLRAVIEDTDMTLDFWLSSYLGNGASGGSCVSVIDLSLVPTEVVHVVTAVVARMVFEALQRYVRANGTALPTVLVMEEAHTFIKRYREDAENQDAASVCCQVFERIAREGRKFGLGLVLSSQRPSELSPTVLSQCNSFLLHRISNDRDQELVHRLVPDNLKGLLRELPSLPSQSAILLGWASELPVLVRMNDLPRSQQPRSEDPAFWGVWTGKDEDESPIDREVDWRSIASEWQAGHGVSGDRDE